MALTSVATRGGECPGTRRRRFFLKGWGTSLPRGPGKDDSDRSHHPLLVVRDDQANAGEPSSEKIRQEPSPGGPVFGRESIRSQDLPVQAKTALATTVATLVARPSPEASGKSVQLQIRGQRPRTGSKSSHFGIE